MAKLHGSYEAIEGGMPIEAMVDLTGGLAERYELKNPAMLKTLYKYGTRSVSVICDDDRIYSYLDISGDLLHHRHSSPVPGRATGDKRIRPIKYQRRLDIFMTIYNDTVLFVI